MIEEARLDDAREILTVINTSNRKLYQGIVPKGHFRDPFLSLNQLLKDLTEMTFFAYKSDGEILGVVALQIESEELGGSLGSTFFQNTKGEESALLWSPIWNGKPPGWVSEN